MARRGGRSPGARFEAATRSIAHWRDAQRRHVHLERRRPLRRAALAPDCRRPTCSAWRCLARSAAISPAIRAPIAGAPQLSDLGGPEGAHRQPRRAGPAAHRPIRAIRREIDFHYFDEGERPERRRPRRPSWRRSASCARSWPRLKRRGTDRDGGIARRRHRRATRRLRDTSATTPGATTPRALARSARARAAASSTALSRARDEGSARGRCLGVPAHPGLLHR